jgi:hypothetical protein
LTRSTSGIGWSGAAVAIWRLKRSVVPSNIHAPSRQREVVSIAEAVESQRDGFEDVVVCADGDLSA